MADETLADTLEAMTETRLKIIIRNALRESGHPGFALYVPDIVVPAILAALRTAPAEPPAEPPAGVGTGVADAIVTALIGGNHLVEVVRRHLGIGFSERYPYSMEPAQALEAMGAGTAYEAWCCWRSIMLLRDAWERSNATPKERSDAE